LSASETRVGVAIVWSTTGLALLNPRSPQEQHVPSVAMFHVEHADAPTFGQAHNSPAPLFAV
jgi:hypothetical protein